MVVVALKSTSCFLRFLLRVRETICVSSWVKERGLLVLNATISLGKGATSIGRATLLGDRPTNLPIY
jgi:hypothetical protein